VLTSRARSTATGAVRALPRWPQRRGSRWLRTLAVGVATLCGIPGISACGAAGSSVQSAYFKAAGIMMGDDGARAGQVIDFPARLQSGTPGTVTLIRAQLIPLPGFRTPKLVHLSVFTGCGLNLSSSAWGWPIKVPDDGGTVSGRNLSGARVWTGVYGRKGCYSAIVYGVMASSVGPFAAGGLRITFKTGGHLESAPIFNGGFAWLNQLRPTRQQIAVDHRYYLADNHKAFEAINRIAPWGQH
jgi:hypothetical protein